MPPSDLEVPPSDLEVPPSDLEVPPSDLEVPPSDLEVPLSDLEVPPSDLEVPPSDLELQIWSSRSGDLEPRRHFIRRHKPRVPAKCRLLNLYSFKVNLHGLTIFLSVFFS